MRLRHLALMAAAAIPIATFVPRASVAAQQPMGRVHGRVIDAGTGRPLGHAAIQLVGTTRGVSTAEDGRYVIADIPAGAVTLHVRLLGYQPKTVTGILLEPDASVEQNITLEQTAAQLSAMVVTAAVERGSANALLDEQRNSTSIVNAVGSEQMSRSPDGDAAQAVRRVSGVTIQDGKYVQVRGLGERYTAVSLNGSRMASPEPERRAVPLDLFPASLIQSITTHKTFTPDQPGDFSGARVDIRTREFPARSLLTYSLSIGMNDAATGRSVLSAPATPLDWLAFGGADRQLPWSGGIGGPLPGAPRGGENFADALSRPWSGSPGSGAPDYGLTVSLGGSEEPFGQRVGYIASLTYSRKQEVLREHDRSQAVPLSSDAAALRPYNSFSGSTGRTSVLWGGILNMSTWLGDRTKISLDNSYDRNADNEAYRDEGIFNDEIFIRRSGLRYTEHSVRSNQLRVEHSFDDRQRLGVSLTNSAVARNEPDRSDVTYGREYDPIRGDTLPLAMLPGTPDANKRTSSELHESVWDGKLDYAIDLGAPGSSPRLELGGAFRSTHRTATQSAFDVLLFGLTQRQREASPEEIFASAHGPDSSGNVVLSPNQGGGYYEVNERIPAGYVMLEQPLGDRLRLTGGVRAEHWDLDLRAEELLVDTVRVRRGVTDLLPAASLTYDLTGNQKLRLSVARTLSRPEYREMAPISYRGAYGDQILVGNTDLERTLIENYDARWEWYPGEGEVVSVGAFAKRFHAPIERIDVATSGAEQLGYANASGATNYGVELELRTGLYRVAPWLSPLGISANATIMTSEIDLGSDAQSALQNSKRAMVGQAPYVLNAALSYTSGTSGTSATVLYNVVGRRIFAAGVMPRPDSYEEPRGTLDASIRFPFPGSLSARIDAKNLLDTPYRVTQGNITRERYTTGRVFSLGLSWQR